MARALTESHLQSPIAAEGSCSQVLGSRTRTSLGGRYSARHISLSDTHGHDFPVTSKSCEDTK